MLATQNPVEMQGTYPLPEAQLDRFLLKLHFDYPSVDELTAIVRRTTDEPHSRCRRSPTAGDAAAHGRAARRVPSPTSSCSTTRAAS